jgi:outer membrane protein TolC
MHGGIEGFEAMSLALLLFCLSAEVVFAQPPLFEINLCDAEKEALIFSNQVKSSFFNQLAAQDQVSAQFMSLLPKFSFQANYQYYGNIPEVRFPGLTSTLPFGTNSTFQFGANLNYTLWDAFSNRKSYQSLSLLAKARAEDRKNAEIQLLYSLRSAYIQVQLGIEELRLIHESLEVARNQHRDVLSRYRAGAATRLDLVTAERSVLSYEIQFKQRQGDLSSSLKDLLSFFEKHPTGNLSKPGPPALTGVSIILKLESFADLLKKEERYQSIPPEDDQPQIRSQTLQAESYDLSAESQSAKYYPKLEVFGGVSLNHPNIPYPPTYWQETVGVSLSLPLFLGDPTPYLAAQQRNLARAARYRENQARIDLQKDFAKAQEMLESFRDQRQLASKDIVESEEEAKLYYTSYKAGKINLIDVQNANLQAFQAKINAARIDAQILNQLILLKLISGREL